MAIGEKYTVAQRASLFERERLSDRELRRLDASERRRDTMNAGQCFWNLVRRTTFEAAEMAAIKAHNAKLNTDRKMISTKFDQLEGNYTRSGNPQGAGDRWRTKR